MRSCVDQYHHSFRVFDFSEGTLYLKAAFFGEVTGFLGFFQFTMMSKCSIRASVTFDEFIIGLLGCNVDASL